ncbi:hypothetical protein BD779DRAFT_1610011 [Infundibulicybe gibba]|nr:hypothetical protein BD779DRAFT_1610011 [Infundibulicybe gibba]
MTTPSNPDVDLKWLDGTPPTTTPTGSAFGIPWPQSQIDKTTAITVTAGGKGVPVQTWPMAYWPDGSLKWTGHALAADAGLSSALQLAPGTPVEPTAPVTVTQSSTSITVTTGSFSAKFNTSGTVLINSLSLSGKALAQNGALVVNVQNAPDPELDGPRPTVVATAGRVDSVTVEQKGPVRAVIKVLHLAGATSLRMVHFFIFDGDQNQDFIKGIGLKFTTPLSDELYNRHVRFLTADGGVWGEPVRVVSGLRRDATAPVLTAQFNGQATPALSTWPTSVSSEIDQLAVWADFSLDQLSANAFNVRKRTVAGDKATFIDHAGFGTRASGLGFVGGATGGGVVFALRDFWQGAPRSLDIRNAGGSTSTVTLWAYSPKLHMVYMPPSLLVILSHYLIQQLDLSYEDVGDPDPNPIGVGRSYEATLQLFPATPSRATLAQLAAVHTKVPQIVASPSFYVSRNIFGGRWGLPDTSTSGAAAIEKQKSDLLDFYITDIDQRQFYGFWHYGDVMHTYDQTRHTWRYDVGGFAWDNGELASDLWMWMSFLRTGRADVFRVARAMTRHLSEVDFHHIGPFAGLGSRHNVSHWGDGAKEARISGSTLKRPFYYLTTDELIGDIMDFSLQADQTIMTWDPLRKVFPPPLPIGPGRLRIGPDWTTLAGNWFTKWERTNDPQWLNRLKTGMLDIGGFKFGLFTGNTTAVGWNADTAHLVDEGGEGLGAYDLVMFFGGGEFLMEAMDIITDVPTFDAAWLDFCRLYNASDADKTARYGKTFGSGGFNQLYAKLQAYAGQRLNSDTIKKAAWTSLASSTVGIWAPVAKVGGTDVITPVLEIPNLATNDAAQRSLTEYAVLAIAPEFAPNSLAPILELTTEDQEWDQSTANGEDVAGSLKEKSVQRKRGGWWKKLSGCL